MPGCPGTPGCCLRNLVKMPLLTAGRVVTARMGVWKPWALMLQGSPAVAQLLLWTDQMSCVLSRQERAGL